MSAEGIAIVGMSGRFPGARDVSTFWNNVKNGVESVTRFSPEELEVPAPTADAGHSGARFVAARGVLDDVDQFDAQFFGYVPREAELIDPQHRIFLELCWEALEHAGYDAQRYPGAIGVFGGCYFDSYLIANLCSNPAFLAHLIQTIQVGSLQTERGNDKDYLATRVAFKLGLRGPAMTLQTACSTGLVSIATACQSLDAYQSDMALAGGVTIVLPQRKGYYYSEGGMLSPDGHCRTFDEHSAGTVFSNGAAVVLLKRVADAIADGDTIYALIRGYAVNNDGAAKMGFTAPSVEGQAEAIALALSMAGVDARTIGLVEAHGTATPLGDPIEVAGLVKAYRPYTTDRGFCAIGSVKSNLGHLDVASGAIGLIKTALAVHEGVLPPSINFTRPNPKIDFASSPFYVNVELRPWPAAAWPRRAGVSALGVGGTNAHVILEQPPETAPPGAHRRASLLLLSARSEAALAAQAERLAAFLEGNPALPLDDVAYTLQVGRCAFEHRRIAVVSDIPHAVAKLRKASSSAESGKFAGSSPRVIYMFPGQGTQYPGMARELHASEPAFREVIDRCCAVLAADADHPLDLRSYLLWDRESSSLDHAQVAAEFAQTRLAQPGIFAMQLALARLLSHWGIRPTGLVGHSVGEFAAACEAGIFEIEDAVRLVATRGRLMQAQPAGRMLAVRAAASKIETLLPAGVTIAAINAPELTVVSGPADLVDAFSAALADAGLQASTLVTSHAYHSPMMAAVRAPLVRAVAATPRQSARIPVISTALARLASEQELSDPAYWGEQLLNPVRFAESIAVVAEGGDDVVFLEVGSGQTLTTLSRQTLAGKAVRAVVPCLGPAQAPGSDLESVLAAVGRLWAAGADPDWESFQAGVRRRVALPTYPFERKRYWVEPGQPGLAPVPEHRSEDLAVAAHDANSPASGRPGADIEDTRHLIEQHLALVADELAAIDAGKRGNAGGRPVRGSSHG